MLLQHLEAKWVNLHLKGDVEARRLKRQFKSADTAE